MYAKVNLKILLSSLLSISVLSGYSQKIASLEVKLPTTTYGVDVPVSVNLDEITYLSDTLLTLYEVKGKSRIPLPFQIEPGGSRKLHWIVKAKDGASGKYLYELVKERSDQDAEIASSVKDGTLVIHKGAQNLLQYYYKTVYPPKGVDTAYKRSGFIHPLWAPHGQVLTRIQPPDHYHHYGIWNPWTHVEYEGDTIDFWNINSKQGTVRFANFTSIQSGPVFAEFSALHEHMVLRRSGAEKVALNEIQSVKVYCPQDEQDFFIVDFTFSLNTADESPFRILE
jgi:hypothetical protein